MVRDVDFVDGDKLWKLVEQYLPVSIAPLIQEIQRRAKSDTHYAPHFMIGPDKTEITFSEKFPGAAREKPISIKPRFVSEASAASFQAIFQKYQETGEAVEIPSELIEGVELPDFLKNIFGVNPDQVQLSFIPPPFPDGFPVRISVLCDDGDEYIRDYIVLKGEKAGTKQATIVSEERDAPFRLTMKLEIGENSTAFSEANFLFQTREAPYNALQYWEWLQLNACLSKPSRVIVYSIENGFNFFETRSQPGMTDAPQPELIEFYRRLATIQQKTKVPILLPERDFSQEEVELIENLFEIVHIGRVEGVWDNLTTIVQPFPKMPDKLAAGLLADVNRMFVFEEEQTATLFTANIPIGRVRTTLRNAGLKNAEEFRAWHDQVTPESTPLELIFEPAGAATTVMEYIDWLPDDLKPQPLVVNQPTTDVDTQAV